MITNDVPDPKCPKCDSYYVTVIPFDRGNDKGVCNMCEYYGDLETFYSPDTERLNKAIYGD